MGHGGGGSALPGSGGGRLTDAEKQEVTNYAFQRFKQNVETGDWTPPNLLGLNDFSMFDNDRSTPQAMWDFGTGIASAPDSDVEADLPLAENQNMDYDENSVEEILQPLAWQKVAEETSGSADDLWLINGGAGNYFQNGFADAGEAGIGEAADGAGD
ncbi:MAG: hypothetical protein AB7D36_10385, partial [Oscillospiraceae bacterium]